MGTKLAGGGEHKENKIFLRVNLIMFLFNNVFNQKGSLI